MKTRGRLAAWEGTGGLFQEATPAATPMRSRPSWLVWLWGPGSLHSWRVGLAKPGAGGAAGGALKPAVATAPPPSPGLPFKAAKRCLGGDKTQIRHGPGSSEPGCGLVQGVRGAGNSNQTGPSGQPPARWLPDPLQVPPRGLRSGWARIPSMPSLGACDLPSHRG